MALTDGIIGCWSPSLGASGYRLLDRSGRGNHGTLTNMDAGTDWVGTSAGLSLDYDGSNDYVAASANTWAGRDVSQLSAVAWVRLTKSSGYGAIAVAGGSTGFTWYAGNGGGVSGQILYIGTVTFGQQVSVSGAIAANTWTMLAWSYNTRAVRFWRDSSLQGTATVGGTVPLPNVTTALSFGTAAVASATEVWQGQIGEIAMFQRALADAEFADLYRRGNGAIGRELTGQTRRRRYGFVPATGARRRRILCGDYN
jgi:hypothetical protein